MSEIAKSICDCNDCKSSEGTLHWVMPRAHWLLKAKERHTTITRSGKTPSICRLQISGNGNNDAIHGTLQIVLSSRSRSVPRSAYRVVYVAATATSADASDEKDQADDSLL
jgi:hypothetical protein